MNRYVYAYKINGIVDAQGIIDTKHQTVFCLCSEEDGKMILEALSICESLANVSHMMNPEHNPHIADIIEKAKEWRKQTEGGWDGKD